MALSIVAPKFRRIASDEIAALPGVQAVLVGTQTPLVIGSNAGFVANSASAGSLIDLNGATRATALWQDRSAVSGEQVSRIINIGGEVTLDTLSDDRSTVNGTSIRTTLANNFVMIGENTAPLDRLHVGGSGHIRISGGKIRVTGSLMEFETNSTSLRADLTNTGRFRVIGSGTTASSLPGVLFRNSTLAVDAGGLWQIALDGTSPGILSIVDNSAAGGDFSTVNTQLQISDGHIGVGTGVNAFVIINASDTITSTAANLATGITSGITRNTATGNGDVRGADISATNTSSAGVAVASTVGAQIAVVLNGGATFGDDIVVGGDFRINLGASHTGSVTNTKAIRIPVPNVDAAATDPTDIFGIDIFNQGNAGTTTSRAIRIQAQSGSTTNRGLVSSTANNFMTSLKLGGSEADPAEELDVAGDVVATGHSSFGGAASVSTIVVSSILETLTTISAAQTTALNINYTRDVSSSNGLANGILVNVTNVSTSGVGAATAFGVASTVIADGSANYSAGNIVGFLATIRANSSQSGTIADIIAYKAASPIINAAASDPTDIFGVDVENQGNAGTTTSHAIRIQAQSGSTDNFGLDVEGTSTRNRVDGTWEHGDATELTIATGAVTATKSFHTIDTEADAATDDLDTINGGQDGMELTIRAENTARTVVARDGTGNLDLSGDFSMDSDRDTLTLVFDSGLSVWLEKSRSNNA